MRIEFAVDQDFAFLDMLALKHVDVAELRNQRFNRFAFAVGNHQALLALGFLAERNRTGHFAQDRRFFRFACFKQVRNPGQTTGDIAVL